MHDQRTYSLPGVGRVPLRDSARRVTAWATVDLADLTPALLRYRWRLHRGYAYRDGEMMHRRILGLIGGDRRQGDHINRNRLDNRRANLRIVPGNAANAQNCGALGGSSEYRGVTWDKRTGRWLAQAGLNGRNHHIGRFDSELDAAAAARAWRAVHMPYAID